MAETESTNNGTKPSWANLATNPLGQLVLTLVLGGSAVGGFVVNNSQWASVSEEIKACRTELTAITVRFAQFESNIEATKRIEAAQNAMRADFVADQRAAETRIRELETTVMRQGLEIESLKGVHHAPDSH